jgi:hypothetical protein
MPSPNIGIEHRRTVHGGDNSALSVEVSAWRYEGANITQCNHELPDAWDGLGVYIRNPLAFHIADFNAGNGETEYGTILQAKAVAFKYADALADHLGCSVESHLKR